MSKRLIATYRHSECFNIPDDLDLNDKSQVEWYDVKWNTLNVKPVDGELYKIEAEGWINEYDYKRPVETEIECDDDDDDTECCPPEPTSPPEPDDDDDEDHASSLLNYYGHDEKRSFMEYAQAKNKEEFIDELKCHIYYSLIHVAYYGHMKRINEIIDELWIEHCDDYNIEY